MSRPLRIQIANGVYHVTSRGLERRALVRDDLDRARWVDLLGEVACRRQWHVLAWVLMDNHFHLFVRTPQPDLSAGLHDLNGAHVTRFNRRHDRCGPLLQGRFKAILVERNHHYWELSRYIHLNPVRAGLARRPEAYAWGSCRAYFASRDAPDWLAWEEGLRQHGRTLRAARRAYRQFLQDGLTADVRSPLQDALAGSLLGSAAFLDRMKAWLEDRLPDREVPAARALRPTVSIDDVVSAVCRTYSVSKSSLSKRGRHRNEPRAAAIYVARRLTRATITQIGTYFGGVRGPRVSQIVSHLRARRSRQKALDVALSRIESDLGKN